MSLITRYLKRHWLMMSAGLLVLVLCDGMQIYQPLLLRDIFNKLETVLKTANSDSNQQDAAAPIVAGQAAPAIPESRAAPENTARPSRAQVEKQILYICVLLLAIILATALTRMTWRLIIWPLARRMEYEMRRDLFEHMRGLPPSFFHASTTGDLMSRATSDIETVRRFYGMGLVSFTDAILILPLSFVLMAMMDPALALAAASPLLIGVPLSSLMMRRLHARYKDGQDSHGVMTGRVQEDIAGVRALKTFAREDAALGNFDRANSDYTGKAVKIAFYDALFEPYFRLVPQIGFVAVLGWGGWKVCQGQMPVGNLVAFLAYVELMIWPIFAGGMGFNMLQRARASATRLEEVLNTQQEERPPEEAGPEKLDGNLSFRNLTFTHRGQETPSLSALTLNVPPGQVLGITGPTGSGKSTLLNISAGLLVPPEGTVLISGADIHGIGRAKLRRSVTLVEQTPFLFSRSLEDNLAYGRSEHDPERVREAVRLASLEGEVSRFEKGMATIVGERGVTLSGGQRLRAALARALVIEPRVLLLDDVFSAVDVETEKAIWSRIRPKLKGTTVIVVSHRISVLRECDRVAVIEAGRLTEYGTHAELIAGRGFYSKTFALQEQFES